MQKFYDYLLTGDLQHETSKKKLGHCISYKQMEKIERVQAELAVICQTSQIF